MQAVQIAIQAKFHMSLREKQLLSKLPAKSQWTYSQAVAVRVVVLLHSSDICKQCALLPRHVYVSSGLTALPMLQHVHTAAAAAICKHLH
jgi:hypothetical protein